MKTLLRRIHPWSITARKVEAARENGFIVAGPFRGFPTSDEAIEWFWPQLLGVYERPLHPTLERWLSDRPQTIVDVGAASGYYAVGFACRCPESRVVAFEMDPGVQARLRSYASRVGARIDIRGCCQSEELLSLVSESSPGILFMDCEGAERHLLSDSSVPLLKDWRILVELHDWHAPGAAEEIQERFSKSHTIEEIWTQKLMPGDFDNILHWPLSLYCINALRSFCDERRNCEMRWFAMAPKKGRE